MAKQPSAIVKMKDLFKRKHLFLFVAVLVIALAFRIGSMQKPEEQQGDTPVHTKKASEEQMQYQRITPDEAKTKMTADVIILDVRTPEEFDAGRVPNAILLPDYEIGDRAADLLPDKDQIILVYCRSGRRSQAASMELIAMGYAQVYDFGGIIDWNGDIEK